MLDEYLRVSRGALKTNKQSTVLPSAVVPGFGLGSTKYQQITRSLLPPPHLVCSNHLARFIPSLTETGCCSVMYVMPEDSETMKQPYNHLTTEK